MPRIAAQAVNLAMSAAMGNRKGLLDTWPRFDLVNQNLDPDKPGDATERHGFQAHLNANSLGLSRTLSISPPSSLWRELTGCHGLTDLKVCEQAAGHCAMAYAVAAHKAECCPQELMAKFPAIIKIAFSNVFSRARATLEDAEAQAASCAPVDPALIQDFSDLGDMVGDDPSLIQKSALRQRIAGLPFDQALSLMKNSRVGFHLIQDSDGLLSNVASLPVEPFAFEIHAFRNYQYRLAAASHDPLHLGKAIRSPSFQLGGATRNEPILHAPDGSIKGAHDIRQWADAVDSEVQRFEIFLASRSASMNAPASTPPRL